MREYLRHAAQLALLRVAEWVDGAGGGEEGDVIRAASHLLYRNIFQQPDLGNRRRINGAKNQHAISYVINHVPVPTLRYDHNKYSKCKK